MKQLKYPSSFFMVLALLFSLGCASTPSQESTGEFLDDSVITTKVKAAIFDESSLKSTEINVTTERGVVVLSGTVSTSSEISKAAEVARGVTGVKSVKNELKTK
ncbi:MAG: BON domain-containing protein [Gallionella sp.]